jgi:hypothetical protein
MTHLFSFTTTRFDVSTETPNPINPIPGECVLRWLRPVLQEAGFASSNPETEDWGWYLYANAGTAKYLVGASGETRDRSPKVDWIIQLHVERSFKERLTGRNKLRGDDALSALLERIVRTQTDFEEISVEKGA